jgi:hypothetical protein
VLLLHAQRLCVTLLSAETTAFVWDLCLLAGWQQLQPALAAVAICLREGMLASTDAQSVSSYMQQHAAAIPVVQLQRELEQHFLPAIREDLEAPSPASAVD